MTATGDDRQLRNRRMVYALLITLSAGAMLGRILAVDSVDTRALERRRLEDVDERLAALRAELVARGVAEPQLSSRLARKGAEGRKAVRLGRPFLSANDRSRWCTVRALVEPDMRVPGAPYAIDRVIEERGWDTIDMVYHDGHFYSSKPPLFVTMMAGLYWVYHHATGADLGTRPYEVARFMLIVVNLLPMIAYLVLLARHVERFGRTDWGKLFVVAAACFGTFLTTFAVTINNHIIAAVAALLALDAAVRIWFDGDHRVRWYALAGLWAAFAAANELPALAFFAALSLALLWKSPLRFAAGYVPAALVVGVAFFGTNWIAHGSLRPPYAHRSKTDPADNWYAFTYERGGRKFTSYWQNPQGIDRGEPSPAVYVFHALVGHHGVFSLTPIWVFTAVGLGLWLWRPDDPRLRQLAMFIAGISLVCLVFYLTRGQQDRNYSGMSSGFRWMFWFAPMWLVAMLPALDALAPPANGRSRGGWPRVGRVAALAALGVSVLSASYPTWNPWTHPWLYQWMHYYGWINS